MRNDDRAAPSLILCFLSCDASFDHGSVRWIIMMMGGASMWSAAETGGVQSFFIFRATCCCCLENDGTSDKKARMKRTFLASSRFSRKVACFIFFAPTLHAYLNRNEFGSSDPHDLDAGKEERRATQAIYLSLLLLPGKEPRLRSSQSPISL